MKAIVAETEVVRVGGGSASNFKMNFGPKAFKVLSTSLYKRIIDAVVREICCNAFDSHRSAGNSEPYDVHLPTYEDPRFSVRDYGTGIKPDQIEDIYTTYLGSTKDQSSDDIGGWGLGTKAPFAYTKVFNVINYYDGVAYHYTAYMDSDHTPKFDLNSIVPATDAPNGVEVVVAVQLPDVITFSVSALNMLRYFPTKPNLTGRVIEWNTVTRTQKGKGWYIEKRENLNPVAVMGNVSYPIDLDVLATRYPEVTKTPKRLTIEFDINEIDMMPSREELSYDDASMATIRKRIGEAVSEINARYRKKVNAAPSFFAACEHESAYRNTYGVEPPETKYDGMVVAALVNNVWGLTNGRGKKPEVINPSALTLAIGDESYAPARCRTFAANDKSSLLDQIIILRPKNGDTKLAEGTKLPSFNLADYEPASASRIKGMVKLRRMTDSGYIACDEELVDPNVKGLIFTNRGSSSRYFTGNHLKPYIKWLVENGHLPDSSRVYYTKKYSVYKDMVTKHGWIDDKHGVIELIRQSKDFEFYRLAAAVESLSAASRIMHPSFDKVREYRDALSTRLSALKALEGIMHVNTTLADYEKLPEYQNAKKIFDQYPLLKEFIRSVSHQVMNSAHVYEYIDMVDARNIARENSAVVASA